MSVPINIYLQKNTLVNFDNTLEQLYIISKTK